MSIKSRVELSIIWPVIASNADYLHITDHERCNAFWDDISDHFDVINCEGEESLPVRR